MTFEDKFPGLKRKKVKCLTRQFIKDSPITTWGYINGKLGTSNNHCFTYIDKDIQENCLDKAKVREVIDKIMKKERPEGEFVDGYRFQVELKKELNLK